MKTAAGKILATPLKLIAFVSGLLHIGSGLKLWRWIWHLTGEPDDCCKWIVAVARGRGLPAARQAAEQGADICADARVAAAISWLELRYGGKAGPENARQWIERAKQQDWANEQALLHVELYISGEGDPQRDVLIEQILGRNDLPMEVTRSALTHKAWRLCEQGRWDEAEAVVERILAIEEHYEGELLKWMCCQARGASEQGSEHLERVKRKLPEAVYKMLTAQGWLLLGERRRAMEKLRDVEESGYRLDEAETALGRLAHCEEYEEFKRQFNDN